MAKSKAPPQKGLQTVMKTVKDWVDYLKAVSWLFETLKVSTRLLLTLLPFIVGFFEK